MSEARSSRFADRFSVSCRFLHGSPVTLAVAARADGSANSTARGGASSYRHVTPEERRKRTQRSFYFRPARVGRRVGRRKQSRCRGWHSAPALAGECHVVLERSKLQIDDLSSLPEVRRADAVVGRPLGPPGRPAVKTPAEMVSGFLLLLRESNLDFEDVVLLGDLRRQKRFREWKKWDDDLRSMVKEHVDAVKAEHSYASVKSGSFRESGRATEPLEKATPHRAFEKPPDPRR